MKKKLLSLLLTACMLLSLCACGAGGSDAPTEVAPAAADNSGVVEAPDEKVLDALTLPLASEKEELSVWLVWTNDKVSDPNELEGIQYLEELTNVHINWIPVPTDGAGEKMQLLTASADLPDIIVCMDSTGIYAPDKAIADGWAMDMSGLIATVMPNYRAFLAEHPYDIKASVSDDGVMRCYMNVAGDDNGYRGELQWAGLCVRSDLIEKAGYTGNLETVDDYHQMLLTCKANLENLSAPLYLSSTGTTVTGAFLSAYGVSNGMMSADGKAVSYGPVQEGYGQWLEEMRKWYAEGLIDPNFDTVGGLDPYFAPASVVGANQTVCFTTLYNCIGTVMPMILGNTADPTAVITPVLNPVLNSGDTPAIINVGTGSTTWFGSACTTGNVFISSDCKNPELAAMWLDFMLTEQAMVAGQYGREGVQYTLDTSEDAPFKYVYNEGYQTEDERLAKLATPAVGWYNWSTGNQASSAQMAGLVAMYAAQGVVVPDTYQMLLDAKEMWDGQAYINNLLGVTLSDAEQTAIATTLTDITTRTMEYTIQYIKGQTDEPFADFCAEIESMNLQTVIDTYQAAYERFMNK